MTDRDKDILKDALDHLNPSPMTREEWLSIGMVLKEENYDVSVWEQWSRKDASRFHEGECQRLWKGFRGCSKPLKGGTIIKMAEREGWTRPFHQIEGGEMEWDDVISFDGDDLSQPKEWNPVADLKKYLTTLFDRDNYVGYVTNECFQDEEGKWRPRRGVFNRTAGELLDSLERYPDDIGATIGDWKKEAGAWIRFNALDGKGAGNDNVASYKYALVECDSISIEEQDSAYRKYELPVALLVHSGGRSLHAIVRIDARDAEEYRKRVERLYDFLEAQGVPVDRQNKNPSRLSRMPGVTRNNCNQFIVAENIGRHSWVDFEDYLEGVQDTMPQIEALDLDHLPQVPEAIIDGILRRGHKMLISGPSKAGKSFLLMELAIAIAEGREWLGFQCRKGRVLYVNLEIDSASFVNRFAEIYKALGLKPQNARNIEIWNLRGHAIPMDQLVPKLIRRVKGQKFDAIIVDPIYKVITGDENNASEMGRFCNQFDKICTETGCATIYCHHHSKGAQGAKKAMDRASGSGVFARDPDAQLDIIGLELSDDQKNNLQDNGATPWRLESSLREFRNIRPVEFWFEYPIHRVDTKNLKNNPNEGTADAGRLKNKKVVSKEDQVTSIRRAFEAASMGDSHVSANALAEYLEIDRKTIINRIKRNEDLSSEFEIQQGIIFRRKIVEEN